MAAYCLRAGRPTAKRSRAPECVPNEKQGSAENPFPPRRRRERGEILCIVFQRSRSPLRTLRLRGEVPISFQKGQACNLGARIYLTAPGRCGIINAVRRRSQVARQGSAKPRFTGSNPVVAFLLCRPRRRHTPGLPSIRCVMRDRRASCRWRRSRWNRDARAASGGRPRRDILTGCSAESGAGTPSGARPGRPTSANWPAKASPSACTATTRRRPS